MDDKTHSVSDIESFIDMLRAACEDRQMRHTLERILSQPDKKRKEIIMVLVEDMVNKQAPVSLIEAIACLRDDAIAEKAYEVIYRCTR